MDITTLISTEYESFEPNDTISTLVGTFADPSVRGVIVEDDRYHGVVTRRQLATSHHQPNQRLGSIVTNVPRLHRDEGVRRVAQLMVHSDAFLLPVMDDGSIAGVVTADAIVDAVRDSFTTVDVAAVMSDELVTLSVEDTLGRAIPQFREHGIAHLPVVDTDIVGIVSLYDLVDLRIREMTRSQGGSGAGEDPFGGEIASSTGRSRRGGFGAREGELARMLDLPITDVMASPVATVDVDASLAEAVAAMRHVEGSSVVVTDSETATGIVTITDVLRSLTLAAPKRRAVEVYGIDLLDGMDHDSIVGMIDRLDDRYGDLTVIGAKLHLHEHDETLRGRPLIRARIRLHTDRGMFIGTGEGFGGAHAIREARDVLERRLLDHKEHARTKKPMDDQERWEKRFGWWMDA